MDFFFRFDSHYLGQPVTTNTPSFAHVYSRQTEAHEIVCRDADTLTRSNKIISSTNFRVEDDDADRHKSEEMQRRHKLDYGHRTDDTVLRACLTATGDQVTEMPHLLQHSESSVFE